MLQEIHLKPEPLDLPGLAAFFQDLADAPGSLDRIQRLADRLATLHPVEGETIVKLLTGDLRIGLKEGLVEDAVAAAFQADPAEVRHAHMLTGDIGETALLARRGKLTDATLRPLVPVKCMLAAPLERERGGQPPAFRETPVRPAVLAGAEIRRHPRPDPQTGAVRSRFSRATCARSTRSSRNCSLPSARSRATSSSTASSSPSRKAANSASRTSRNASAGACPAATLFLTDENQDSSVPLRFVAFDILSHNGEDLLEQPLLDRREKA